MSDDAIEPVKPIRPGDIKEYRDDFEKGFDLFKKSFKEYQHSEDEHKQVKLQKVMEDALLIMNKAAKEALSKSIQHQSVKLASDHQEYIYHPSDDTEKQLKKDIKNLENSL